MYIRIPCQGCGRRLKLPYGADPRKARCPTCGTRVESPDDTLAETPAPVAPKTPVTEIPAVSAMTAAKPLSLDDSRPRPALPKPLPLDDNVTILSLDDDDDPKAGPKPSEPEPFLGPFPPQRFHAVVQSDSKGKKGFEGAIDVVVTPHGLFLEPPGQPFLYVPVGTPGTASGPGELTIEFNRREIELQFVKVGNPNRLARDVAALLGGQPLILATSDYRRPHWLPLLALGLAAVVLLASGFLARSLGQSLEFGLAIGGGLAILALLFNLLLTFRSRYSLESRVLMMNGLAASLMALFGVGEAVYLRTNPAAAAAARASETPEEKPPAIPFVEYPAQPALPPPPSYLDIASEYDVARIEDGPAAATAIAMIPGRTSLLAAYADGTTRLWPLDRPTIEDWHPGPTTDGPTRFIRFGDGGKSVLFAGTAGLVITTLDKPPAAPLKIAGDPLAITPAKAKERDRIAVLRGRTIAVKLLPAGLSANPSGKPVNGFIPITAKQESPDTAYRLDLPAPAKLTFLTFHPTGLLLGGQPDGSVISWPQKGSFKVENTLHKAPVRVIAYASTRPDMAMGDEKGVVTLWNGSSMTPTKFTMLNAPVAALAIDSKSQMLAAVDPAGNVVIHSVKPSAEVAKFQAEGKVAALAFGPDDQSLLLAIGKAIEIRMIEPLRPEPPAVPAKGTEPPKKVEPPKVVPKKKA